MVDTGQYFTINRARQYGKTTTLQILGEYLASDYTVISLDFLSQLRGYYIRRGRTATFQSVILAGVYDIKNIRKKLRTKNEHRINSPWNIAADFLVDISFSTKEITKMLTDYENDYHTGMNIDEIAQLLYDYTSGYPFLVSRICKLMDERIPGGKDFPDRHNTWTKKGFYMRCGFC